jgi:phage recombination protein Bet
MTETALTTTKFAREVGWDRDQVDLIKRTVAQGASDDELRMFLYQAQRTGLDPLSRQIYCIMRYADGKPRATIQTGIDGYRLAADRTGLYAGNDDYRFNDGQTEYEVLRGGNERPATATATVWKIVQGQRVAFSATTRWEEYYPGDKGGAMWRKMPFLLLGKCAEALALRKAFPAELSGLYTDDEMAQAGPVVEAEYREVEAPPAPPAPKPAPRPTEARAQHTREEYATAYGKRVKEAMALNEELRVRGLKEIDLAAYDLPGSASIEDILAIGTRLREAIEASAPLIDQQPALV